MCIYIYMYLQGDSGGPIHQWLDDHWEQVGIVSFGQGCAEENHPGVYTRLSIYHDWIQATINQIDETTSKSSTSISRTPSISTVSSTAKPAISGMTTSVKTKMISLQSEISFIFVLIILLNFILVN